MKITMPIQKQKDHALGDRKYEYPRVLFRPRPFKAGEKATTKVIIPAFSPTGWRMFNPTAEQVSKFGLMGDGSGLIGIPNDLVTFTFNLATHPVEDFTRPDGSVGRALTLCPKQMNDYLTQVLEMEPMFRSPKCAFCEEEQRWWDAHNERWEQLGIDKGDLNRDGYWAQINADSVLKSTYNTAKKYKHQSKNVVALFNYSKMLQEEPMEENESLTLQLWYSPKSVLEKLYTFYEEEIPFYDLESGAHILKIIKNTQECSGNDLMRTKYDVMQAEKVALDQQWADYLSNPASLPDPSDLIHFISYEEQQYHVSGSEGQDYNNAPQRPAENRQQPGVMAPPRAPDNTPENEPVNETPTAVTPPTTVAVTPLQAPPAPAPQAPAGPPVPMIPGAGATPPPATQAAPEAPQAPAGPPVPAVPAPRTPPPGDRPPGQVRNWD